MGKRRDVRAQDGPSRDAHGGETPRRRGRDPGDRPAREACGPGANGAAPPTMPRLAAIGLSVVVMLGVACAREAGTGTTTVTSAATSVAGDEAALRLADEICNRQEACGAVGVGARYRSVEACMADQAWRAPAQLARWSCAPSRVPETFETCLAAIRGEHCETSLTQIDELNACRSKAVCGR